MFLFSFPLFLIEKPCFLPIEGILFIFECLPLFLLSLLWPPPFFPFASLLLFHEKTQHQKYSTTQLFFINPFFFRLSLFFFLSHFLYLCFFSDLKFSFLFNIIVFLKKCKLKTTNFWSRGGLQHNGFLITCVLQNVKSYRFFWGGGFFCQVFVDFQKAL